MLLLDRVTSSGHDVAMKKTRVTDLKARLSHYLRLVRKGETITVYDRDKPVAELIPMRKVQLTLRAPVPRSPKLHEIPRLPPMAGGRGILDLLLEERAEGRDE